MTHTELHRPARIYPAPVDVGVMEVAAPPHSPLQQGNAIWQVLLPMIGSFGIFGFAIVMGDPRYLIMAGVLAGAMLVSGIVSRIVQTRTSRRVHADQVARYRTHLATLEGRLTRSETAQRRWARILYPPSDDLWSVVVNRDRVWERRPDDDDFLGIRLGRGSVRPNLTPQLSLGSNPLTEFDPEMLEAAEALVAGHREVADEAVVADIEGAGCVAVVGNPERRRSFARAVLGQLAIFRAPDDLRMIVFHGEPSSPDWSWARLLPHSVMAAGGDDPAVTHSIEDLGVLIRQIACPRRELLERSANGLGPRKEFRFPQTIIVVDGYHPALEIGRCEPLEDVMSSAAALGFTVICLVDDTQSVPEKAGAMIELTALQLSYVEAGAAGARQTDVKPAQLTLDQMTNIARVLSRLQLRSRTGLATTVDSSGLIDLLGLDSPDSISADLWQQRHIAESLTTPIGLAEDGSPVVLDLKESSEGGQGPHGVLIGATGSGKSELLRTLVLGLAVRHAPEDLAMVLVDFKGGATFAKLDQLPHTAGMITNLEREPGLIDRMQDALHGELERRQRVLHATGSMDRADHYRSYRLAHPELDLEPMPALLVVVDEFGELLANRPEFADLFMTIGRTGRSLGVHLLLSSQRLEEGRIRKLEGHLRYRLCLRTFTADESQIVIGTKAAAELPPIPGVGFMGVDGVLQPFKAGYVNRPVRGKPAIGHEHPTEMSLILERLGDRSTAHRRARPIWLEPLPTSLGLEDCMAEQADEGAATVPGHPWLAPVVGIRDDPRSQALDFHRISLSGASGHLAVVGAPRSGKSTVLHTLVVSLAYTHDPADLQIYAIDLGGGGLHAYEPLPHVGAVLSRSHRQEVPRLIRQLRGLVDRRAELFRLNGITGMEGFHRMRRDGSLDSQSDAFGEVVFVIDNWAAFNQEFDADIADEILELVTSGLHYGVHVVVTTSRWQDIRMAMRDNIGGRFELRLNDPIDSEIDRRLSAALPEDVPGRALAGSGLQVQVASPTLGRDEAGVPGDVVGGVIKRWAGAAPAPPIRMLPDRVTLADLERSPIDSATGEVLGVEETALGRWTVDLFGAEPHFIVLGDAESGKTNLLRTWIRQMTHSFSPSQVLLAIVDRRRKLLSEVPESHLLAAGSTPESIARLASAVAGRLAEREMPDDMAMIGHAGPEIVVFVDDYDQVAGVTGNPLAPLTDWIVQGRDVGFHMVVARRVGGVTRSSFEPLYQRIKEIGTPGLVMSGDPMEGPVLGGIKAGPQPPGRGVVVGRGRSLEVQVAYTEPSADVRRLTRERTA